MIRVLCTLPCRSFETILHVVVNRSLPMARGQPTLPNLLVIGAAKAGTTSLHSYLSLHPEIFMSQRKELNFFDDRSRWNKGVEWYKSNFNDEFRVNGETSPQYSRYPRNAGVPDR